MSLQITQRWRILRGTPGEHICWLSDDSGKMAVMKRARDRSDRKLIEPFNEFVCSQFAGILGITTAETHLERVDGEPVVVSIVESELNFSYVLSNNLTMSAENVQFMAALLASDWWLANTDRAAGKNEHLVVIKTESGVTPRPIDYSHALNGCSGEIFTLTTVNDTNRIPVSSYNHISEPYVRSFRDLEPTITRIATIGNSTIDQVVGGTADRIAQGRPEDETAILRSNALVVKAMLRVRRDTLRESMKEWCRVKGRALD